MIQTMLRNLNDGPALLRDLLSKIPDDLHKQRRIPGKWCIHEHACHLGDVQVMLYDRFLTFKKEAAPVFKPYLPGTNISDDHLMEMDLEVALDLFETERKRLLSLLNTYREEDWQKLATHPEYHTYSAEILLRHVMMHDHFHMYRIEELWLTSDAYLRKG